ncbi:TPA: hypothetical protein ACSCX2_001213 [Aeromonas veronii]
MYNVFKMMVILYLSFFIIGCSSRDSPSLEIVIEYHVPNDSLGNYMPYKSICSPYKKNVVQCEDTTEFQPQSIKERDGDKYRFGYLVSQLEFENKINSVIHGTFTSQVLHKVKKKSGSGEWTGYFDSGIPLIDKKMEVKKFNLKVEDGQSIIIHGVSSSFLKLYVRPSEYSFLNKE